MVKFSLILSLQHAIRISHKNCSSCTVNGSNKTIECTQKGKDPQLTEITGLCEADYMLNYALLDLQSVKQTHVGCENGQLFTTDSIEGDHFNITKKRLCLEKETVKNRKKRLVELLGDTFNSTVFPNKKNVRVIARATASQRDAMTGEHLETEEWDTLVIAVKEFFTSNNFQDMRIMPIENEGKFALKAIQTLVKKKVDLGGLWLQLEGALNENRLISMEQGGRSMQIWSDTKSFGKPTEIPNKEGITELFKRWDIKTRTYTEFYGDYTGLYSNLGNGEIIKQLGAQTKCLIGVQGKPSREFNKGKCRQELNALNIIRSKSDKKGTLPKLRAAAVYVAVGCFYYPAEAIGISDKKIDITTALKNVQKFLKPESQYCPDNHPDVVKDRDAMKCMQLMVLEMILDKMIQTKNANDTVEIVFLKTIDGEEISWTVGLAETMKEKIKTEEQADVVVLDIGSSSTKIFRTTKEKNNDSWSAMTNLITLNGGDLKKMTAEQPQAI